MKKLFTLLCSFMLLGTYSSNAQIFWVENFEGGSTAGLVVGSYTSTNGAWSETNLGSTGSFDNKWYVSCAEQGHTTGVCGDVCGSSVGLNSTLHLGSSLLSDAGASYFASVACNRRAESPTINCTGHSNITLSFYYIEDGELADDDGSVYYYNGSTWALLTNTAKTPLTCSPQGTWAHASVLLPASANNNPNVKIGFLWVNDADASATDPSYAIDSMSLSSTGAAAVSVSFTKSATTVCEDSCITFTSTSTGTIDSIKWSIPGVTIATPTVSPVTVCFPDAGTFPVKLYAYHGTATDSASSSVTINPAPHPTLIQSGHTLTVSGTYSTYQWSKNDTAIAGATTNTYTYGAGGVYQVTVDSGGCKGMSPAIGYGLGVAEVSANGTRYAISQSGSNSFTLYSSFVLTADLDVILYDATGRQLMRDVWQGGSDKKQFNADYLSSGIYIIRLGNSTNSAVLKWIKQ